MDNESKWIINTDCIIHEGHSCNILIKKRDNEYSLNYGCPDNSFPIFITNNMNKEEKEIVECVICCIDKWEKEDSFYERLKELKKKQEARHQILKQTKEG